MITRTVRTIALLALIASLPLMAAELRTATIALPTLQCGMCKKTIEGVLTKLDGVKSAVVDVAKKEATVSYDPGVVTLEQLETTITLAGYDANERPADRKAQRRLHACCQPGSHD